MDESINNLEERQYELTFLIKAESAIQIKEALAKAKGNLLEEKPLEKVHLAYPIKKENYAYLGSIYFAITRDFLSKLQELLRLEGDLLRYNIDLIPHGPLPLKKAETVSEGVAPIHRKSPGRETNKRPVDILTNEALEKTIEEILK